jgi:16S rRNA (uracil1498-N3)-methyltransferase
MTNARCYIPPSDWSLAGVTLGDDESHHLVHVLRAKAGQKVEVFNGEGGTGLAVVETIGRGVVAVRILERSEQKRSSVQFALIQALPREQKMDLLIQKAVELGVSAIIPVLTEHSLIRLKEGQAEKRKLRWDKIALSAAKQCGAVWLTDIHPPESLGAFLKNRPQYDLLLACALTDDAKPLRDILKAHTDAHAIAAAVGPEGDFSPGEMAALRAAGAVPVSFGEQVLRTETAALYILSTLKYEFQA